MINENELTELTKFFDNVPDMGDWMFDPKDGTMKLKINTVNDSKNPLVQYKTEGSSGFDLAADIIEPITLKPFRRVRVKTNFKFAIPKGFELQIRSRSGLADKHGVIVLNSPGTVDSDYRGYVDVLLYNTDPHEEFLINSGDRIAQGVIQPVQQKNSVVFNVINKLDDTDRGSGGFGHTGI